MSLIQLLIIALAVLILFRTTLGFIRKRVGLGTFIFWLGLWLIIITVALMPDITVFLAKLLGIGRGVDVAVYFSIIFIFFFLYRIMARLEKIEHEITKIVREKALKEDGR